MRKWHDTEAQFGAETNTACMCFIWEGDRSWIVKERPRSQCLTCSSYHIRDCVPEPC